MSAARNIGRRLFAIFVCLGFVFGGGAWVLTKLVSGLSMNDGPYTGTPAPPRLTGMPYSSLVVSPELTLESYDPLTSGTSALVQMRHAKKGILWSINADSDTVGDTPRVEFKSVESHWRGYSVNGSVHWTYGHEASWWDFDRSGNLRDFYNSW